MEINLLEGVLKNVLKIIGVTIVRINVLKHALLIHMQII